MRKETASLQNVYFKYSPENDWVLKDVSFQLFEGEWVALVGHNGSGKSTIAKLLNGLLFANEGSIEINGHIEVTEENVWEIRRKVGMVFQNPDNQFVGTTVKDDVAFGLENLGVERREMIDRIQTSLEQVGMLEYLDQEPHHLSGGQKQRVAIAGILALEPSLMILDEATSMLDPRGRKEVLETVRHLQQTKKMSVVSITHDLEEMIQADRMIVMNEGEVFLDGTTEEVFRYGEKLLDIGLDLPFSVKLSEKLIQKGIALSKRHLSQEDLVKEIWTLYSKT